MTRTLMLSLAVLAVAAAAAPPAEAQAPKAGRDWYEDSADLGFKIKAPDGWDFIPPSPDETNLIGKYVAPGRKGILDVSDNSYWPYQMWLVRFEQAEEEAQPPKDGTRPRFTKPQAKDLAEWLENRGVGLAPWSLEETKETSISKVDAVEYQFSATMGADTPIALYAMVFRLRPGTELAVVFNGPGEKKWNKFESAFRSLAKSLRTIDVEALETSAGGGSFKDQKRIRLRQEVASQPGWELYETPNYFIVSNNPDKAFLEELMGRLEAIRKVYEETYPPSLAEELRQLAKERKAEEGPEAQDEEGKPQEAEDGRTRAAAADAMERSKACVVRVCGNREQYSSYGGPSGSAGYWSSNDEELVVYDDKAVGGRRNTWATVNHVEFHQYIFYFFGNLSPHSWYNEGTGDFYSGYEYKYKRFELKPFDWRVQIIKDSIREGKHVPLKDLVRFKQPEYYGSNKYGTDGGQNYAQGWSLIWFLRTGAENTRCWNDAWGTILDTYLRVLVETDDLDKAVDAAFAGVDWDALEACWKEYVG